jgi:amino acid transporter
MLDRMTTAPGHPEHDKHDEKHRLTAVQGLAALSLDALSSVAYGPEAILVVLVAAGTAGLRYSLPITGAIIILLAALVVSYRQVIAAFPGGGGAYAVAKAHLGTRASLVAAASLIVDYVLNAAVGVSAGIAALTSAFPALYGGRVWLCLAALALITGLNLWGVAESAKVFTVPTLLFIVAIAAVILGGLVRTHPAVPLGHHLAPATETVGVLLILRAFASGCSALTGVEAIANAVPEFRQPRARRAQLTEVWLGTLLGAMLIGLGALIHKFDVVPQPGITVLAQLTQASLGHNIAFYAVQLITLVLLALAANTSFGGLPVLAALLAKDNFLPHMFGLRADRQVHRYGVITLALLAAALLVAAKGDTQALVPLFAVGVFVGFTLSQVGMVRHWRAERSPGWSTRAGINAVGAVLTAATTVIELVSKFTEGAWVIVLVIPGREHFTPATVPRRASRPTLRHRDEQGGDERQIARDDHASVHAVQAAAAVGEREREDGQARVPRGHQRALAGAGPEPGHARRDEQPGHDVDRVAVQGDAQHRRAAAPAGQVHRGHGVRQAGYHGQHQPAGNDVRDPVPVPRRGGRHLHDRARRDHGDQRTGRGHRVAPGPSPGPDRLGQLVLLLVNRRDQPARPPAGQRQALDPGPAHPQHRHVWDEHHRG